jgi:hypothetical protein
VDGSGGSHKSVRGSLPRRHEVEELASVAVTGNPRGSVVIRHERIELAQMAKRVRRPKG